MNTATVAVVAVAHRQLRSKSAPNPAANPSATAYKAMKPA